MGTGLETGQLIESVDHRAELIEEVKLACGRLGAVSAMFRAAVAAKRGLTSTEERAIGIIERAGRITGSSLAQRLRLTRSAVTGVLKGMSKKGLIRRIPSFGDARSYLVELDASAVAGLHSTFASFAQTLHESLSRYSDEDLETILDFARELTRQQLGAIALAGP